MYARKKRLPIITTELYLLGVTAEVRAWGPIRSPNTVHITGYVGMNLLPDLEEANQQTVSKHGSQTKVLLSQKTTNSDII